jgi:GLPGLI family protein
MKNLILLILLIIKTFNLSAQSELHVEYSLLFDKSSFKDEPNTSYEEKEMRGMILKSQEYVSYNLLVQKNESIFYNNEFMFQDNDNLMLKAITMANEKFYYCNFDNLEFKNKLNFIDKNYVINFELKKWEITNESKIIEGFTCYKAITYNIYENEKYPEYAWFTPEIPFKFGPVFCLNLPGLVLEYQTEKASIVAKSIKYKIDEKLKIKIKKPEGKIVTQEEFDKIVNEYRGSY